MPGNLVLLQLLFFNYIKTHLKYADFDFIAANSFFSTAASYYPQPMLPRCHKQMHHNLDEYPLLH